MDPLSQELTFLEGAVSSIVFRNEENGYTVLRLDTGQDEITVIGCMPGVAPGEGFAVHGTWETHSAYGPQLRAEIVERRMPKGEKAVVEYLASGAVKGVGVATARRLVDTFGADTLVVMEEHPEELTQVKGITRKRALAMGQSLRTQMSMRRLLDFLSAHGLSLQLAMPLHRRFGALALEALRDNPYLLTDETFHAPFTAADQLALSLGMSVDSPLRLEAGLLFELTHNLDNGHVFLPYRKLLDATARLLKVELPPLEAALDRLTDQNKLIREDIAGEDACYLSRLHRCEIYVAQQLKRMAQNELFPPPDLEKLLRRIQDQQGIAYAPLQEEAVKTAARRQVMLLTGGPGTGKTTSLRGVLALFDHLGLKTALAAPTGRAAKRMSEACGAEASTIHRLLETRFDADQNSLVFAHNESNPLEAGAVIVDEASMVDIILMQALLAALPNQCRLILVGDPHQLPSVGPGNLLSDLLRSEKLPTLRLTEIFRQAAQSAIIRGAYQVDQGQCPALINSADGDFFFLRRTDPGQAVETMVELCRTRLPQKMGIPADQIQVLTPTRRGLTGTAALNQALQEALNPAAPDKGEKTFGSMVFRQGDRVMQVRNNYDILWEESQGQGYGMGIFNGDIGIILSVDPKANILLIDFDGRLAEYPGDLWNQLEPAYAVTVHKSQGSEYRAVILAALPAAPMLLTRGVLYTAMTRAKELLILVGDDQVIARMAKNDRQQRRYSGLRARMVRDEEY